MSTAVLRIVLLAGGMALGELGLDSMARGSDAAVVQLGLALVLLVAGSAGVIVPLLWGNSRQEVNRHV